MPADCELGLARRESHNRCKSNASADAIDESEKNHKDDEHQQV